MKYDLRFAKRWLACLLLSVLFAGLTVSAQSVEQYFISAKAGGINLISGKVSVRRKGETTWGVLASKIEAVDEAKKSKSQVVTMDMLEKIDSGDTVRTEETGRLEVLLNPGSYLRLAENSELEMIDSSLDSLRLKLNRGTAILEATGKSGGPLMTEVVTPHTTVSIVKTGLYRINVLANNTTEVFVRKGRAMVGTGALATLKDGKKIVVAGGAANANQIAGFDKKAQDAFDFWSKQRAESLIAVNSSLPDAMLSNAILNTGYRPLRRGTGLWVYDPIFGGHTFFPFYNGWHSPYGSSYAGGFGYSYDYYRPYPIYNNPSGGGGRPSGNTPNTPANPNTPSNPDDRRRNVRERKNMEGDVLPIRPVESNAQGQRPHRDGGGASPSYRQPSEGNYGNRSSSGTYRQNTQPAPSAAPARQEPAYRQPTYSAEPRYERPAENRSGPRGKNLDQRR